MNKNHDENCQCNCHDEHEECKDEHGQDCECECEEEQEFEDFEFDLDLEEEMDIIYLTLDDDTETECAVLGIFEVEDNEYIALVPFDDDQVFLYRYVEEGDDFDLFNIDDDEEFEIVSEAFELLFAEEDIDFLMMNLMNTRMKNKILQYILKYFFYLFLIFSDIIG